MSYDEISDDKHASYKYLTTSDSTSSIDPFDVVEKPHVTSLMVLGGDEHLYHYRSCLISHLDPKRVYEWHSPAEIREI